VVAAVVGAGAEDEVGGTVEEEGAGDEPPHPVRITIRTSDIKAENQNNLFIFCSLTVNLPRLYFVYD
jgi:hypothetical protein